MAGPPDGTGTPLGQRYLLHEALGQGAMGRVHRATKRDTGEEVAAKVLWPELAGDPDIVARFVQERLILTRIKDPHVVQVLDLVAESDTLVIIAELVHGSDLRRYLKDRGTLPPASAAELAAQVLRGLAVVHDHGVIHRDVKPANVLLDLRGPEPVARLTDFGIARLADGPALTSLTGVLGTAQYIAPEVADRSDITPKTDVYSAGVMLYELLAGVTPFSGGPREAVLRDHSLRQAGPIPGLPDDLWGVLEQMLAKDPAKRPSARAAAASLEALAPRLTALPPLEPLTEPPAPGALPDEEPQTQRGWRRMDTDTQTGIAKKDEGERRREQSRRQRRWVLMGSVPLALVVVAVGLAVLLNRSGGHPRPAPASVKQSQGGASPPGLAPGAPSGVIALAINGGAAVAWTPPGSTGSSPLTGFLVESSPGGVTATAAPTATATVVAGLVNGTTYTFVLKAVNAAGAGQASAPSNPVTPTQPPVTAAPPVSPVSPSIGKGYWLVGSDGGVFAFGVPGLGSRPETLALSPIVGMAATPSGKGYWLVDSSGGVFVFGDASYLNWTAVTSAHPYVGVASTPTGRGFWLVGSDGGVFAFGDAPHVGSLAGRPLNGTIVGMAATPSGKGYWLVGSDGGVFAFGDASSSLGSLSGKPLNAPIVGMAATPSGNGYWLVGSDGGVFAFGDAPNNLGSLAGTHINAPIVGMAATPSGSGYWLVGSDGGIFAFGDAPNNLGSLSGTHLNGPIVGIGSG